MKRTILAAAVGAIFATSAGMAFAVNEICDGVLSGVPGDGECQVTTLHDLGAGGTFSVDRALHIIGPLGQIKVDGAATLNLLVAGNSFGPLPRDGLVMDGGRISANTTGTTGVGGTLNIVVASGNVLLHPDARISADNTAGGGCGSGHAGVVNLTAAGLLAQIKTDDGTIISANGDSCDGGVVNIFATNQGSIDVEGKVLSWGFRSGSGTPPTGNPLVGGTQRPGGGPITVKAACDVKLGESGLLSSKGADSGADKVAMDGGCNVLVNGVAESLGSGHAVAGNPPNSCSDLIPRPGSVRRLADVRIGKPFNTTACIEVWAGKEVTINTGGLFKGELNADTGKSPGGNQGTSWIDIFAKGKVSILNTDALKWSVHANGLAGTDNGGVVTVRALDLTDGSITLAGQVLQASALGGHGQGGDLDVGALAGIDLIAAKLQAKSGLSSTDSGGHVQVRSFKDIVADLATQVNVLGHTPPNGTVHVQACNLLQFVVGNVLQVGVTTFDLGCPSAFNLPAFLSLQTCTCGPSECICPEGQHAVGGQCIPND